VVKFCTRISKTPCIIILEKCSLETSVTNLLSLSYVMGMRFALLLIHFSRTDLVHDF
jgi:hypothetical protein